MTTPPTDTRRGHPPAFLVSGLVLAAAVAQTAIVPLLPRLADEHGLSDAASAALIAAPGAATFAVAVPAGLIADRLGARRVTLAAGALLAAGVLAQARPDLGWLLAGRLAFGVAYGIVWTTAVAWLAGGEDDAGAARRQAAVVTGAAIGVAAGPGFGALLAARTGFATPFLVTGLVTAALTVALARTSREDAPAASRPGSATASLRRLARAGGGLAGGAVALGLSGATNAVLQLLVPLQLHRAGASSDTIGLAFSCAAGIYIAVSALVGRLGHRAATPRTNAIAAVVLALALFPAGWSGTALAVLVTMMLTVAPRATLATIAYPLAAGDAERAGIGHGVAVGLLNGAWAAAMVAAPFAAGAISGWAGPRAAWLATLAVGALVAGWLLAREARATVRAA